ncbi:cation diffusion facilitator family transporter [Parafilimonas sp.]|uniref:cation diffusion facilitator family transporter n=1 Tax=Parafilimonas sp. TaxID=1969739 RepID=UPI0039E66055
MQTAQQNFKVQKWITALSVILFAAKIVAYYFTNSLAVLSDALESIVNVLAGFIGLYSLYVAAKPKDADHPYGHGKAEFVSAAAEGSLIVASGILILYEAVINFISARPLEKLDKGVWLIALTAVLNFIAGLICLKIGKRNRSLALQASGRHLIIDTWSTLAIVATLAIILFTKFYWLDKIVACIIAIAIIFNGYNIVRRSLAGIMDEADMQLLERMVRLLNEKRRPDWIDIHNLRIIKYGSILHIDCHLTLPFYLNVLEAHEEVVALENLIISEFGDQVEMFVHTDGSYPVSCAVIFDEKGKSSCVSLREKKEWKLENIMKNERFGMSQIAANDPV